MMSKTKKWTLGEMCQELVPSRYTATYVKPDLNIMLLLYTSNLLITAATKSFIVNCFDIT